MNDLEQFRAALQAPDHSLRPLDIATIMQAGTRVRRRRRLLVGAGSGLAVLALLLGGNVVARTVQPSPTPSAPGAAVGAARPGPTTSPSPTDLPAEPPPAAASTTSSGEESPLGDIVSTGLPNGDGEWAFCLIPIDSPNLPGITMGIQAGRLLPSGRLIGVYRANETQSSDRAAGFHAVSGSQQKDGEDMPAFGYYVGPVEKITGRAGDRTVRARQQVWSKDPDVVIFWFDLTSVDPDTELTKLTAYDENGDKLPSGNNTVAVG